ncbi:YdcF family protein [Dyadobacter luteus]|uniref:YdcF family protein n=2 Tax=Dyadobacter luteus TaxID=2259619 RepID=A0A3D8YHG2_9BACT|nr:YdcF family protein [Dyadobacter luteus]
MVLSKNLMRIILLLFFFLIQFQKGYTQQNKLPDPNYKLVSPGSFVQSKNYYLLTLFQQVKDARIMLEKDDLLQKVAQSKLNHLRSSVKECKTDYLCYTSGMKFSDQEIKEVGKRLKELYNPQNALGKIVKEHLLRSGSYILLSGAKPDEFLRKVWEQDAKAVNHAIEVYAEGKRPNYPAIDSIAFNRYRKSYPVLVYDCADVVRQESKDTSLFFGSAMHFALQFLEINERSEAADYEPMESTVNKAAFDQIKKTDWSRYKYAVILVPGAGPDTYERALSEGGILRCRVAAKRYFEGQAPFIIVSGGRVHPFKTKYSEAFEMKKFLIETLHVPENAIIMEPHARHTTTNIRNAVRLMFRYGMPMDKPSLVSTMRSQSYMITSDSFAKRCMREINHIPYKSGKRISDTDSEFFPVLDALQIDADEPMDP